MQANRGRDTAPELRLRSAVHALGLRYRVDTRPLASLRRTADLVFRGPRIAVFVDGCFWHGCPEHYSAPATNESFWAEKVAANVARDRDTDRALREAGWTVLRFWEHDDPGKAAAAVQAAVARAAPSGVVSRRSERPGDPSR
ncbi:very short patch repair endonuclease [Miltoncostaea marina]|uniref:very short patch repair endonuclease n=1 Tax=Miltoncostaea marina TaxID=2843215 RepID=UPI003CCEDC07